jgi:hypothetical protein
MRGLKRRFDLLIAVLLLAHCCSFAEDKFRVEDVLDLKRSHVRNFAFSASTRRLFVSHADDLHGKHDDRLYQWNIEAGKVEHVYRLGAEFMCDNIALSPSGLFLVVGCWPLKGFDCKVFLIDAHRRQVLDLHHKGRISAVYFDQRGNRFAVSTSDTELSADSELLVYNTSGQQIEGADLSEFQPVKDAYVWSKAPEGKADPKSGLYCRDRAGEERQLHIDNWHENYASSADGVYIAATTWHGDLLVLHRSDLREVFRRKMAEAYGYLRYDSAKNRFLWADATGATTKLKALTIDDKAK